jgi:hypothetical protein
MPIIVQTEIETELPFLETPRDAASGGNTPGFTQASSQVKEKQRQIEALQFEDVNMLDENAHVKLATDQVQPKKWKQMKQWTT